MRSLLMFLLLCLTAFATPALHAQDSLRSHAAHAARERTVNLTGQVYDAFTKAPLTAHITLMRADSTVADTTTSSIFDRTSVYEFRVPRRAATYLLRASCEGYHDAYLAYELKYLSRKTYFELPRILMRRSADIYKEISLDDVEVTGTKVKLQYRGDTIVYHAAAFNLPDGSMLDALIRQLPGAELRSNGDIFINGQKMDYLTLNGKDFFRGDNQVMLDNLPYYTVKDLKVYHKSTRRSRQAGHDVERKDYVMDVLLRRDYNSAMLGNAETAAGTGHRYMARLFALAYNDHTRLAIFGNTNNVNETRRPGSKGDWKPADSTDGLTATKHTGLHLSHEHPDKIFEEELHADLKWTDNDTHTRTLGEHFAQGESLIAGSDSRHRNRSFAFNANNTFALNKPFNLMLTLIAEHQHGRTATEQNDSTWRMAVINAVQNTAMSKNSKTTLSGMLSGYHELPWGDIVSISLNAEHHNHRPDRTFERKDIGIAQNPHADFRNTLQGFCSKGYNYDLTAGYTFAFPNKMFMELATSFKQKYAHEENSFYRLDWLGGDYAPGGKAKIGTLPSTREEMLRAFDTDNYDSYDLWQKDYSAYLHTYRNDDNSFFDLGLRLNHTDEFIDYRSTDDYRQWRSLTYVKPHLSYFNFGNPFVSLLYEMNLEMPDFVDVLPTDDTTDPLNYSVNNTALNSQRTHALNARISWTNDSTKQSLALQAGATIVDDAWGVRRLCHPHTGAYSLVADNVSGNWMASAEIDFSRPLDKRQRLTLEQTAAAQLHHSVDFDLLTTPLPHDISDQGVPTATHPLRKVDNLRLSEKLALTCQSGSLTVGAGGQIAWQHATSAQEDFCNISAFDFDYGATLQYTMPFGASISTDLRMYSRRGYASNLMNDDHLVWNAQLSHSFLKKRLTATLRCFDLLHQLSNTEYEVNAQGRTETWHQCLPRYVMLSLAWHFGTHPSKKPSPSR